ncbi:unnamed protein product, partial [Brassica rapa subsp. trilocularis]
STSFKWWISNYKKVSLGPVDRSFSKNTLATNGNSKPKRFCNKCLLLRLR